MNPRGALMDFEIALSNGVTSVFPSCSIWRDFFHFQQANVKQLKKLGITTPGIKEISRQTSEIWKADQENSFIKLTESFIDNNEETMPEYINYFVSTWLERFPPRTWAKYGNVPTGILFFEKKRCNDIKVLAH